MSYQHALGRPHAGQNCPGTGPGDDQEGEPWPAGNMGNLIGTGLDTRAGSGGFRGPYQIIAPGANGFGNTLFDLMSYCVGAAGETSTWTSPLGWNEILNYKSPPQLLAAARPAQATTDLLAVTAVQLSDGSLHIGGTRPGRGRAPDADPAATYQVEARDQAGDLLWLARPRTSLPSRARGPERRCCLTGSVPAPAGTAQLVVRRGTETATRRVRSANAPTVRLLGPRGTVSGRGAAVRWRAADRDGDALTATIEYSRNDGRSWRTVEVGPARGSALGPLRLLGASRRARIRVRVDDGFREAVATSPRLRVAGAPPLVRILDPVRAQRIRADAPLYLRGEAAAEGGAPLPFRALRWFDGRRPLGQGCRFSVSGLRAGRHRIRLVVRRAGRTGTASTLVTVRAVQPAFLRLDPPARLSRRARRVRLRVASTMAADLRVGGRRFRVGPRARTVSVAISPGSSPLRLALRLRAGSLSTTRSLTLARSWVTPDHTAGSSPTSDPNKVTRRPRARRSIWRSSRLTPHRCMKATPSRAFVGAVEHLALRRSPELVRGTSLVPDASSNTSKECVGGDNGNGGDGDGTICHAPLPVRIRVSPLWRRNPASLQDSLFAGATMLALASSCRRIVCLSTRPITGKRCKRGVRRVRCALGFRNPGIVVSKCVS